MSRYGRAIGLGLLLGLLLPAVIVVRAQSSSAPLPLVVALQATAMAAGVDLVVADVPVADVWLPASSGGAGGDCALGGVGPAEGGVEDWSASLSRIGSESRVAVFFG